MFVGDLFPTLMRKRRAAPSFLTPSGGGLAIGQSWGRSRGEIMNLQRLLQRARTLAGGLAFVALALPALGAELTDAEVRKIDKEQGRLTLKHAEIKSLDMPPMTMVFQVRDRTMLENLKVGDKIKFKAVQEAGKYTVTELKVGP
jgi:Cu/Ag efflux protein CusF